MSLSCLGGRPVEEVRAGRAYHGLQPDSIVNRKLVRALEQWRASTGARYVEVREESGFATRFADALDELLHFQSCRS